MAKQNLGRVRPNFVGNWEGTKNYKELDIVLYNGSSYVCNKNNTNLTPEDYKDYWVLVASKGDTTVVTDESNDTLLNTNLSNLSISGNNIFERLGLVRVLTETEDINAVTTIGYYKIMGTAINLPALFSDGMLIVLFGGDSLVVQFCISKTGSDIHYRVGDVNSDDTVSWQVWNIVTNNLVNPVGSVSFFASNTMPTGYLLCDGAVVSRTEYSNLFDVIGTTYGEGDGSTTFNLPDSRGLFIRCHDGNRGMDSGRVLGSFQDDSIKKHIHPLGKFMRNDNDDIFIRVNKEGYDLSGLTDFYARAVYGGNASFSNPPNTTNLDSSDDMNIITHENYSIDSISETRPKNLSLAAGIKY